MANPQTAPCPFCAAASIREGVLIAENEKLRAQLAGIVEQCAKVCDEHAKQYKSGEAFWAIVAVRDAIRALVPAAGNAEPVTHKVICHAPGDRCLGCDHYYGKAPVCKYEGSDPAVAWLITRESGATELVMSPLTDDTYMSEGDEAIPLYASPQPARGER